MHTEEELENRKNIGIYLSIQSMLTCLVFIFGVVWIKYSTSKRYEEWDNQTTTISDYTVMYRIPEQLYHNFTVDVKLDTQTQEYRDIEESSEFERKSMLYLFQNHLKRKIEQELLKLDFVLTDNNDLIRISEINFKFEDTEVLKLLIKRGKALNSNNTSKAKKIEDEIKQYLRENWEQVIVPREAYITFRTKEAYLRAIQLDSTKVCMTHLAKEQWKGHPFALEQIQEPSNIYWENRHKNPYVKLLKQVVVVLVLALILTSFIIVLFFIQKYASKPVSNPHRQVQKGVPKCKLRGGHERS